MAHTLLDSEVDELNALLAAHGRLSLPHTTLFGGGLVSGVLGVPGIVAMAWLNERPISIALAVGVGFVTLTLVLAYLVRLKQRHAFAAMQRISSKLNAAGFQVFFKPTFLAAVLSAASGNLPDGARPVPLHKMSLAEFEAALEQ